MTFQHFSPYDQYFIGVDPGQAQDPTAIAVVRRRYGENYLPVFQCGYLERLPLGTPYPGIVWRCRQLLQQPIFSRRTEVILDLTGVGRPVRDLFIVQGIDPISVTITSGVAEPAPENNIYSVPKLVLISGVQALLHDGRLQIQSELQDAPVLKSELQDFKAEVTNSGYWKFGARSGAHDDLVLALALAVWRGMSPDTPDFGLWARLSARDTPASVPPSDLVAGEGQVIVTAKQRIWVAGLNKWVEPGPQVMSASLAAQLSEYLV
jgi:hypothetical protein